MEKRISFFEYQNAVSVAKIIDPYLRQKEKVQSQYSKLLEQQSKLLSKIDETGHELSKLDKEINAYEAGIVKLLGFHTTDLIQKVMVPTGKMTPEGKPAMTAEFKHTNIVKYDETTKEYVITKPDAEQPDHDMPAGTEESIIPPTTENKPGSDFDKDKEAVMIKEEVSEKEVSEADNLPWE